MNFFASIHNLLRVQFYFCTNKDDHQFVVEVLILIVLEGKTGGNEFP